MAGTINANDNDQYTSAVWSALTGQSEHYQKPQRQAHTQSPDALHSRAAESRRSTSSNTSRSSLSPAPTTGSSSTPASATRALALGCASLVPPSHTDKPSNRRVSLNSSRSSAASWSHDSVFTSPARSDLHDSLSSPAELVFAQCHPTMSRSKSNYLSQSMSPAKSAHSDINQSSVSSQSGSTDEFTQSLLAFEFEPESACTDSAVAAPPPPARRRINKSKSRSDSNFRAAGPILLR